MEEHGPFPALSVWILVEIARGKFMEAGGDRERPDAIQYLSVHCDVSPLVLGSPSIWRRQKQRRFENKRYEVIGAAKLAHGKSSWKLRKIIAQLKSTKEGTEGNNCCLKN